MARGGRGGRRGGGRGGVGGGRSSSSPPEQSILAGDGARGANTNPAPSTRPSSLSTSIDTSLQSIQAPLPPPDRSVGETPVSSSSQVPPDPSDPVPSSSIAESSSSNNLTVIHVLCDRLIPSNKISQKMTHIFKTMIHEDGYAWKNVPESYIRTYYEEFQKHFTWDSMIDTKVKELLHKQASRRYSGMISKWKEKRADRKPSSVPEGIWQRWKEYWDTPEVVAKSEQQRKNRYSEVAGPGTGCSRHTGGTKSFVEHKITMEKELGRTPDEFEFFENTHTTHDGNFVDDRSKLIATEVKRRAAELTQAAEGSTEAPTLDMSQLYLDVVGGPKKQRVYGLGSLAPTFTTSGASTSSSATSSLNQDALRRLKEQMEQTFSAQMEAQIAQMEAQMAQMTQMQADREAQMQARMQAQMQSQLQEMIQQMLRTGMMPPAIQTRPDDGTDASANENANLGAD